MRLNRVGITGGAIYLSLGLLWVWLASPPGPAWLLVAWFAAVALVEAFIPGEANQVSFARAHLAAPAFVYSVAPGHLGLLAVVLAVAGLSDPRRLAEAWTLSSTECCWVGSRWGSRWAGSSRRGWLW